MIITDNRSTNTPERVKQAIDPILDLFLSQLAFLEAHAMQLFIVEFLKNFLGRKRPNFFAYCDYKGYREAVSTNNFTQYLNQTTFGVPGNIEYCLDKSSIADSQKSFPSGHSAAVFAGYGYLGIYLLTILNIRYKGHNMPKGFVSFLVLFVAVMVAGTRPRDYWHNYEDVLAGSAIGFACGLFAFIINFSTRGKDLKKIEENYLLTSDRPTID